MLLDMGGWAWSPVVALYQFLAGGDALRPEAASCVAAASLAVAVALAWDYLWGEPPPRLHPVVYMGHMLGYLEKLVAPRACIASDWKSFVNGMLAWLAQAALVLIVYGLLQWLLMQLPWYLAGVLAGVLLKPLLAWRMLHDEVLAVEAALQQSLPAGRQRLSWLVSRDTAALDAAGVRESAIETLAENLSDSVLAPLFWFAVAGLPGAALYRFANTADAMWGYPGWRGQGERRRYWQWAGKWAARADDVLNWLPARITAGWLALLAGGLPCAALRQSAKLTPSPNGGWPMGAMALALRVRLGKPGVYVLNPEGSAPGAQQLARALRLAAAVVRWHGAAALTIAMAATGWMVWPWLTGAFHAGF